MSSRGAAIAGGICAKAPSTGNAVAKISAVSKRGHAIVYPPLSWGSSDELFPASPQGVCEVRGYSRAFGSHRRTRRGLIGNSAQYQNDNKYNRKRHANRFCNRALVSHGGNLDLQKSHEHRSDLQFFALNQTSFADFMSIIHRA